MKKQENIPFVEKYRPKIFDDIVLDSFNKTIFTNIVNGDIFPNLFFYGPPGTGKTTTIINLIEMYYLKKNYNLSKIHQHSSDEKGLHLNASDERGIDTIRIQINNYISSQPLFGGGMKFVILDEVDYLTKNAQQALKYLLENGMKQANVRFCLICNYISKIDHGLQNAFIKIRFNDLPKADILDKLTYICQIEKIQLNEEELENVQIQFKSDMRSMINYLQLYNVNNQSELPMMKKKMIFNSTKCDEFVNIIQLNDYDKINDFMKHIMEEQNIEKKDFLKLFFNHYVRNSTYVKSIHMLSNMEKLLHTNNIHDDDVVLQYFFQLFHMNI